MITSRGTERKTDRAEAFIDAVLAVAITLPVVELQPPRPDPAHTLAQQYAALGPEYATYGLTFLVIGIYWGYSHFSGKLWEKTDHVFNLLTLVFLACVSVTPFPTRPLVEHFNDAANIHTAALVYAAVLTAPALAWTIRWVYGVRRGLLSGHLAPDYVRTLATKYVASAGLCLLGLAITAFASWQAGLAIVGLVTLQFLLPPMAPRYRPGQEPNNEIEEADDRV